jgi:tetratricopeptide (TPR) repeat protein
MRRALALSIILAAPGQTALALPAGHVRALRPTAAADARSDSAAFATEFCQDHLCPLEKRLFSDAADDRLDDFSLLQGALIASGLHRAESMRRYEVRVTELAAELGGTAALAGDPVRKARAVLEFMHRRLLRGGYGIDCTDLRLALDRGRFNCVSASVLYNCLAGHVGLEVCGLETPGHARIRLILPEGSIDVETTCPSWFQLMNHPEKQAELVEKTIGVRPATDRSQFREVSPVQMIAMIYYNRGVDLLADGRFSAAAAANAKALWLDPSSKTARGNLLATLNNWAIALSDSGHHAEAVDLLGRALSFDPSYETFAPNWIHVHHQWIGVLCSLGEFDEAMTVLQRAAAKMPEHPYFREAPLNVQRRLAAAERPGLLSAEGSPPEGSPPPAPAQVGLPKAGK